jgi:hypothetical protein
MLSQEPFRQHLKQNAEAVRDPLAFFHGIFCIADGNRDLDERDLFHLYLFDYF